MSLHSFCTSTCQDGLIPYAGLIQASNRKSYGTDTFRRSGRIRHRLSDDAGRKSNASFGFDDGADGGFPVAAVLQASDRRLYGGTEQGGDDGLGVVFQVSAKAEAVFGESGLGAAALEGLKAKAAIPASPLHGRP